MVNFLSAVGLHGLVAAWTATALNSTENLGMAASVGVRKSLCKDQVVDAVVLQDSSGSLYKRQWEQILRATVQLIDALQLGESTSRIVPITYSGDVTVHWSLDDDRAQTAVAAKEEILHLPHLAQGTNTAKGIIKACEVFENMPLIDPERYKNKRVTRFLFITTDGCSNSVNSYSFPNALKALNAIPNIIVLFVGIGENACVNEMREAAGCKPVESLELCANVKHTTFSKMSVDVPLYFEEVCEAISVEAADVEAEKQAEIHAKEPPESSDKQNNANGGDESAGDYGDKNEREEGGSNVGLIAGGVVGLLVLCGIGGGGAYAYSKSGTTEAEEAVTLEDIGAEQRTDSFWDEKEVPIEDDGSMYANTEP